MTKNSVPGPRTRGDRIVVTKPLRNAIVNGHPWIYDRALTLPAQTRAGDVVTLTDEQGPLATVFVDPGSPIAARVLEAPAADSPSAINAAWAKRRAQRAAQRRSNDALLRDCSGRRLIHGEGDGCPGLVIDQYATTLVVVFDGAAANVFWTARLDAVLDGLAAGGAQFSDVWLRGERGVTEAHAYRGNKPGLITITEGAARFVVDVVNGQKTGFFLDQRENRRLVGRLAHQQRVLNLYCYTGGFSVHAALGGASAVTSVDIAPRAIDAVATNFALNNIAGAHHQHICMDGFDYLAKSRHAGRSWDLVIADPPSFAPNERAKPAALAAYKRLLLECVSVVAPGGYVALASCSSHISEADLIDLCAKHVPGVQLHVVMSAATDHPVIPGFPEGRYLKFLLLGIN
ncbi:MAG: class I SAM-dependent rRNA methyltransferase [Kofleriaceae bacterium]|nr:class I SAM-dependent rRNA methyltransferase [Kofleriaceae bacterium]